VLTNVTDTTLAHTYLPPTKIPVDITKIMIVINTLQTSLEVSIEMCHAFYEAKSNWQMFHNWEGF